MSLEKALEIALCAHDGQEDKAGESYIKHPIRVMQSVDGEPAEKVALLHDAVEDGPYTPEDLEEDFSEEVVEAVEHLTKAKELQESGEESYDDFVDRVMENELARRVKVADIEDNMRLTRLEDIEQEDLDRIEKYHRSWKRLKEDDE
jgi:GTP pyrophosphokinase